jgi:hypothetical protein
LLYSVGDIARVWTFLQQAADTSEEESQACKKEERLLKELVKMTKITSAVGYKNKAPLHIQETHALKVGCACVIVHTRHCCQRAYTGISGLTEALSYV